jgi:hypothetical protein
MWTRSDAEMTGLHLLLEPAGDEDLYSLSANEEQVDLGPLDVTLETLERVARRFVAFNAPDHVFIHAGAVVHAGHAIILPGESFSGKSTLVAALVRAGATYFSDEYAVLDREGIVHPFQKPIALREQPGMVQTNYHISELGGRVGTDPAPLGLVVMAQYRRGARWEPRPITAAEIVIQMFGNTYLASDRPQQSMRTLRAAIRTATGLKGDRGEAAEMVGELLKVVMELATHSGDPR